MSGEQPQADQASVPNRGGHRQRQQNTPPRLMSRSSEDRYDRPDARQETGKEDRRGAPSIVESTHSAHLVRVEQMAAEAPFEEDRPMQVAPYGTRRVHPQRCTARCPERSTLPSDHPRQRERHRLPRRCQPARLAGGSRRRPRCSARCRAPSSAGGPSIRRFQSHRCSA